MYNAEISPIAAEDGEMQEVCFRQVWFSFIEGMVMLDPVL